MPESYFNQFTPKNFGFSDTIPDERPIRDSGSELIDLPDHG